MTGLSVERAPPVVCRMSVGGPSRSAGLEEAVVGPGFISPDHLVRVQINQGARSVQS